MGLVLEHQRAPLPLLPCEVAVGSPHSTPLASGLGLAASSMERNQFLWCISTPVCDVLLQQPGQTQRDGNQAAGSQASSWLAHPAQPGARPLPQSLELISSALRASYWFYLSEEPASDACCTGELRLSGWRKQKCTFLQLWMPGSDTSFAGPRCRRRWAPSRPQGRVGSWSLEVSGGCWGPWCVAAPLHSLLLSSQLGLLCLPLLPLSDEDTCDGM